MCNVPYKDDLVKSVKEVIISIKKLRYNNIFKELAIFLKVYSVLF